jgi:hypothetical protein
VTLFSLLLVMERIIRRLTLFMKDFTKNLTYITKIFDTFDSMNPISGYDEGEKFAYQQ